MPAAPSLLVGAPLDGGEAVAPFFAASRKDFSSTLGFHARAEAVRFVAAAHFGLKRAFRQCVFSSLGSKESELIERQALACHPGALTGAAQ